MTPETYVLKNQSPFYGHKPARRSHRSSGGCGCLSLCCCCFGWCRCCLCIILFIIILLVALALCFYYLLKPNIPSYDFESIDVVAFELRKENKVYTDVVVIVKADNPNKNIWLDYLENNIGVIYSGSKLCSGQIPPFLQPGNNITTVKAELKGESQLSSEIESQFMEDQKEEKIPLLVVVRLPIRLVINDFIHLRKFVVHVNCSLVIDKVQPNKRPNILKKDFTYGIKF
ncbi:NDR1/HIN1-like protein 6 [Cajanus cajan]|nr:NDR1/HIN1-like protein 6 [Cajanus cajan]